ncbi:MAG: ATP-grasp domain-containing protein [Acidobacteria bacterium]|nr:ATP-grasp domain-containing protein [Acidobacteriota bacterium]
MIRRLLIANRGEIALRIIHACRELGIESVAVHSDADAHAPHVAAADRAIAIGPAPAVQSYLAIPRLLDAAHASGADAIHPGYGFLSENAAFADACARAGLIFVGPPAAVITRMGSKIKARRLVATAGVPIVPGETPADQSDAGVRKAVDRVGLPALIKASAGGGGKGMRLVREPGEVDAAIKSARREAEAAFADGTLYVERLVESPRHVEVQIFADAHGHVVHLFERDCSAQRRHQKVIEESPSPVMTAGLRARMTAAAVAAARAADYRNAGTIEFLVESGGSKRTRPTSAGETHPTSAGETRPPSGDDALFYFLEMNTRLQVEHPVTEQVTGLDLVRTQMIVASGEPLPWTQDAIAQRGHAIEARVYAEDPSRDFLPQAGRVLRYREPRLPGVRVDSGIAEGGEVSVFYDPLIAKVIATAETRVLAIARLLAALRDFQIDGLRTNIPFLMTVLAHPAFREGRLDTAFLDREGAALAAAIPDAAAAVVAPAAPLREAGVTPATWDPWAPHAETTTATYQTRGPARRRLPTGAGRQALTAPMPATVIAVHVKPGDRVSKGDTVVLLEAMKMEMPVRVTDDGVVAAVCCTQGELVQADAVLIEMQ